MRDVAAELKECACTAWREPELIWFPREQGDSLPPKPLHLSTTARFTDGARSLVKIQPAQVVKVQLARTRTRPRDQSDQVYMPDPVSALG
jgi:hypothetical protein